VIGEGGVELGYEGAVSDSYRGVQDREFIAQKKELGELRVRELSVVQELFRVLGVRRRGEKKMERCGEGVFKVSSHDRSGLRIGHRRRV